MLNVNHLVGFGGKRAAAAGGGGDTWVQGGYAYNGGGSSAYVNKISNTTFAHTEMTALGAAAHGNPGFGSNTVGYCCNASGTTFKRTYATDSATTGTSMSGGHNQGFGMHNLTVGILGYNTGNSTDKYTYAGDSRTSGTALTNGSNDNYAGGAMCATYGYYTGSGGSPSTSTTKYTFAGDTAAAGSNMSQGQNYRDLLNSATVGLRPKGSAVDRWTYASETESSGTAMPTSRDGYGSTGIGGDEITGVMPHGFTTYYSVENKTFSVVHSTQTWTERTTLTYPRYASCLTTSAAGAMI